VDNIGAMNEPPPKEAGAAFTRFVELIARLRAPGGCPWDREQTHESLKPMTLEEAYEVVEAIDRGDDQELAGELGDLLLQVVFHAQLATEGGRFTIADVIQRVLDKMVRRHPHVFADHPAATPGEVLRNWEALKEEERAGRGKSSDASMLDSVSRSLPATMEAFQMTTKVSRVGFDWPDATSVLAKLEEEVGELKEAVAAGEGPAAVGEEIGDLLFVIVNLSRRLGVDPESALKAGNRKFRRRFQYVEERLRARGKRPADSSLEEMDALWDEAKQREGPGEDDQTGAGPRGVE
jgi:tetrapyrrole methylase family protein/MazG family protein